MFWLLRFGCLMILLRLGYRYCGVGLLIVAVLVVCWISCWSSRFGVGNLVLGVKGEFGG